MERNLDTESAIIANDLLNIALRIKALQPHPRYTDALNAVVTANTAVVAGRMAIVATEECTRFAREAV